MCARYFALFLLACLAAADDESRAAHWRRAGLKRLRSSLSVRPTSGPARNVIFFLGDGMGLTTVTATRIYKGQRPGGKGEDDSLVFDDFPYVSLSKTYGLDRQTSDSANTATAYLCGVKANYGTIGVDGRVHYKDCPSSLDDTTHLDSVLKWAQDAGKSTGFATTTRVTHATPAGLYAHTACRDWEAYSPDSRCPDIAKQLVRQSPGKDMQVILGGGLSNFLPAGAVQRSAPGKRNDSLHLLDEWMDGKKDKRARIAFSADELKNLDGVDHLMGLFHGDHLPYVLDRPSLPNPALYPSLEDMTAAAIEILSRNPEGFFLLVEGGSIDLAHHMNWAHKALEEGYQFDRAVGRALNMTDPADTLIVVTADHSHTFTIGGEYPVRGTNVLVLGFPMDAQSELTACSTYPPVYELQMESSSFNEILHLFCWEILQGCTFSNAVSVLVDYVTSIVEPVGWRAVWRSTKKFSSLGTEYDFIVEVLNVSLEKLEADVYVKSVVLSDTSALAALRMKVDTMSVTTVPLIELFTISEGDDEELFAKTASCIEHVRFFMTHLSRPWDGDDDDVVYTEKILKPRLQLYFDMKNNILSKTIITKIQSILKEGWRIYNELNDLYSAMNVSDSEAEITEDDLIQPMSLRAKLAELQGKMEMLENPVIRSLVMKKSISGKMSKPSANSRASPVTYIISKEVTYEMIKNLNLEPSSVLEFEHNPESAFKCSSSGDKIFIFPGVYQCDTLGWLEGDIIVKGVGSCSDIVLEATGNSDVFLNCCAQSVRLENLSLKSKSGLLCAVLVHHGNVYLKDCIIDSNQAKIGLLLLGGSEAVVENSIVHSARDDGIQMRSLSSLHLKSSKVIQSGRHGILIDAEDGSSDSSFTNLNILDSHVTNNDGHGLFLNNAPMSDVSLRRPDGDFSVLKFFPWLHYQIENSSTFANKQPGVGISSAFKSNQSASSFSSSIYPKCPNEEEFDSSVLSDLLNEVTFCDLNTAKCDFSD